MNGTRRGPKERTETFRRTVFWDPLVAWRVKKTAREPAVAEVARRYKDFADTFATARAL